MWIRGLSLVVWALVAASAAFWGLKLFVAARPAPPHTQVAMGAPARGDLSRLLGTDAPPPSGAPAPAADPRFQLVGVVAPRSERAAGEGLAVIVVDDKPARAYRVGAVVEGQTVLQSVSARGASLGLRDGAAQVALSLPPPAPAAVGQLPPIGPAALPATLPAAAVPQPQPVQQQPIRAPRPFGQQPPQQQPPQAPQQQPLQQPFQQPLPQPQPNAGGILR